MKAIVRKIDKAYLPSVGPADRKLHIVTEVDFVSDAGEVVHNQIYGHLPEQFDGAYFQRQADVMQADIDMLESRAAEDAKRMEEEKPVDDAINKFKLEFGDTIQLRNEKEISHV